jgi:hypothetical protein
LYNKKPDEEAQNQLWAIRESNDGKTPTEHPLSKKPLGSIIYSMCSSDWVLDVGNDGEKLILFPYHGYYDESITQYWSLVSEEDMTGNQILPLQDEIAENASSESLSYHSGSMSSVSTFDSNPSSEFAHGLRPAKRSSALSIHSLTKVDSIPEDYHFSQFSLT